MSRGIFSELSFAVKLAAGKLVRIEAQSFLIATRKRSCRKCEKETNVHALIVTSESKNFEHCGQLAVPKYLALLSYIEGLSGGAAVYLKENVPNYFPDETPQWRPRPYWMNHCEHCHAKVSDFDIIESTIAPLRPAVIESDDISFAIVDKFLKAKAVLRRRNLRDADPGFLASLMIDTSLTCQQVEQTNQQLEQTKAS